MGAGSSRESPNPQAEEYFEIERTLVESKLGWDGMTPDLKERFNKLIDVLILKAKFDDRITTLVDNIEGEIEAQYQLGFLYSEGRGIEKDDEKAVYYLQEASRRGHIEASYLLGCLYYTDRGVPKETKTPQYNQYRGVVLWTKCADIGHADAERKLGDAYMSGIGVKEVDVMKASQHYANATSKSAANAYHQIGDMYESGKGGIEKDAKAAAQRYTLSASEGNAIAKYRLGSMYMEGRGVTRDREKAINLIESAVEQGNCHAQYHLAIVTAQSDPFRAIGLLNHAALQGHEKAKYQLERIAMGEMIRDDDVITQSKWQRSIAKVMQNLKRMRSNDIELEAMAAEAILGNLEKPDVSINNNSIQHHEHPEFHHQSSSTTGALSLSIKPIHNENGDLTSPSKSKGNGGLITGLMNTLSPKRIFGGGNKTKVAPDNEMDQSTLFDNEEDKPVAPKEESLPKRSVVNSTTASSAAKTVKKTNIVKQTKNTGNSKVLKKKTSNANNFRFV